MRWQDMSAWRWAFSLFVMYLCLPYDGRLIGQEYHFSVATVPGALDTFYQDINDAGSIVGEFGDISPARSENPGMKGFLISGDVLTVLDVAGSSQTSAQGLNNRGDVVGAYVVGGREHGFWFDGSEYHMIDYPGATHTAVFDINDQGTMVGSYVEVSLGVPLIHGFIYDGSSFTSWDEGILQTGFTGISENGTMVGTTTDINEFFQVDDVAGFILPTHDLLKAPDSIAPQGLGTAGTFAEGVGSNGVVVGRYVSVVGAGPTPQVAVVEFRGFRYDIVTGDYADIDFPGGGCTFHLEEGSAAVPGTCNRSIQSINSDGTIVGYFDNDDGVFQGFVGRLGIRADLTGDGGVDAADAGLMFGNWGGSGQGDLNGDGIVDAADAGEMFALWTGEAVPHTVPEPGITTTVLFFLAAGSLWQIRKRTRAAG